MPVRFKYLLLFITSANNRLNEGPNLKLSSDAEVCKFQQNNFMRFL